MSYDNTTIKRGASVASWDDHNPRPILERIVERYSGDPSTPEARKEIFELFKSEMLAPNNSEYLDAIQRYWFHNNHAALMRSRFETTSLSDYRAKLDAEVGEIKNRMIKTVLSELVQANGLPLRLCSREVCDIAGGWLTKVAKRLTPDQIVGDVLDEEQLRAIYAEAAIEAKRSKRASPKAA